MHDGRFASLDEVIDFYSEGPKGSPTLEPIMREKANKRVETTGFWGLNLSAEQKADIKGTIELYRFELCRVGINIAALMALTATYSSVPVPFPDSQDWNRLLPYF